MINYILKSILCAAVFFAFYGIFLLPEKMNQFKRWYLLAALLATLLIPMVPIQSHLFPSLQTSFLQKETAQAVQTGPATVPAQQQFTWQITDPSTITGPVLFIIIYSLISAILLLRILRQLYSFWRLVKRLPKQQKDGIQLILLPSASLSFSFMQYICIAPSDMDSATGNPLREIYMHELAHARGRHSLDILIISILQTLFWWNPFLWLYKRAIQLNHEFLADEFVLKAKSGPSHYQALLLSRIKAKPEMTLGSTSIYSLTKKRFKMMTRHTSKRKIRLLQAAGACVASLCLLVLSQHTNAQDTANRQKATTENKPLNQSRQPAATQQMGISPAAFENYQKEIDSHRVIKGKDTTWLFLNSEAHKLSELHAIYQSMSPLQQKKVGRFPPPPPPPPPLKTKNGAHKAPPPPPPPAKTKKEAVNPPPPPPPAKPSAASPAVKAVQPLPALSPVVAVQQVTGNTKSVTPLQRHLAD